MKVLSSIRFWIILMSCITLCFALFLIGEYNKPKAASNDDAIPYHILYISQNHVPLPHTGQKEKVVLKGMVITDATSYKQLETIAKHIKEKYAHANLDSIELTVHNKNNGQYEDLAYEPIAKGNIVISYTTLAKAEHSMYTNINIQLNKHS
ncbi:MULTISPECIES: hypothetical protein [unclassified Bacillus (in: firmicutes)]|uniref:hypothetical protein n=1 Tax=unclassified Bacillus (in: firmicutes) TaxID=185979 RepID=UPI0008F44D4F|nr:MULTISPECIES: hypothetical protein [unclassified Bacillus (in: firmicutes)]SFI98158.1 hypothetical protein SAMN04488574_105262 [Bacillus sp. 71mf]SFS63421.1 hypothetical protein SAMN04488145_10256 [Bacillus sp. 103mf]